MRTSRSGEHVLGNGLKCIIPFLEYYVIQCQWQSGFNEHRFDLDDDIELAKQSINDDDDDDDEEDLSLAAEIIRAKRAFYYSP